MANTIFDDGLRVFLEFVPEDLIDDAIVQWYAECDGAGLAGHIEESDYYDLLRPALVKRGIIDDSTGDET
jgi:hypothetical protein